MRALTTIMLSVAVLLMQVPFRGAYAEMALPAPQVPAPDSAIAETFRVFPNGGDELRLRLMNLILADPGLAPDLVIYMRNAPGLNRAQRLAGEHGLAAAADRLGIQAAVTAAPEQQRGSPHPIDPWFVALSVAASTCVAACRTENKGVGAEVIPQPATVY